MKIAVTGAAGFIGSNWVAALMESGMAVVALDNLAYGVRENLPKNCEFRKVDIRDPELSSHLKGVSMVFHLAAKNCLIDCANDPVTTVDINVKGTANVMRASVECGVEDFIYADTSAEYEGISIFPTPTTSICPQSVYACSKHGGALICEAYSRLHKIRVTTLRYFNVYGPGQDYRRSVPPVMSAFTLSLLNTHRPIIYGSGSKRRDFIHVDDINAFHMRLVANPQYRGEVYNLGSGEDFSMLDILEIIQRELGTEIPPLFKSDLPMEAQRTCADIIKSLATGWNVAVPLEIGLRQFTCYLKSQHCRSSKH